MNCFLFVCLVFICFISGEADVIKLDNICKKNVFYFQGRYVNAFFKLDGNYTLAKLDRLLLGDHLDDEFTRWSDEVSNIQELRDQRARYNQTIQNFYTQSTINSHNVLDVLKVRDQILEFMIYFNNWYDRIGVEEKITWNIVMNTIKDRANTFLSNLIVFKKDQLNEKLVEEKVVTGLQIYLAENLRPGQTLAFKDHPHYHLYVERILKLKNVTITDQYTQLYYSIYVPVSNDYYQPEEKCSSSLPAFYNEWRSSH